MSDIEGGLRQLATEITWPPTPPFDARVAAALDRAAARRRRRRLVLVVAVVLALTVGTAIAARVFRVGSAEVREVGTRATTTTSDATPAPDSPFGVSVASVADAAAIADIAAVALRDSDTGRPAISARLGIVTFAYPARPTLPDLGDGTGLLVSELPGSDPVYLTKLAGAGQVEETRFRGASAVIVTGEHDALFGDIAPTARRTAGTVLLTTVGNLTYRVEARVGRGDLLRLADALLPRS